MDYGTRYAVANQADTEGKLKPLDGVFAGTAPEELGVANTALGGSAFQRGDYETFRPHVEEARVTFRRAGHL